MADPRAATGGTAVGRAVAKMQQARRIQKKWAKKDDDIEDEIKKLETRRCELEMMRLMTRGQYDDWQDDSHWRTFVPYARAWNMHFAELMQAKLPRELRDMVYDYLWDDHSLTCRYSGSPVRLVAGGHLEIDAIDLMAMCDVGELPHFLGFGYVGQVTAFEVVHALYKVLRGQNAVRASTQNLHDALLDDRFRVGFQAITILRELSIYCKLDRYRTPPLRHKQTSTCNHPDSETLYIDHDKLKADLQAFDSIANKKDFRLEILLLQRNIRMAVLTESLGVLRAIRQNFADQGANVQINWAYDDNRTPSHHLNEGHSAAWTRIDEYFNMSQSKWVKRFKKFITLCKPVIQPSHYRIDHEIAVGEKSENDLAHSRWCDSESEHSWDEDDGEDDSEVDSDAE